MDEKHSSDVDRAHAIEDSIDPEKDAERNASVVAETILKHSHDADAALKAFAEHQGPLIEIDEATNKRLLRKIDWHLMPVCRSRRWESMICGLIWKPDYVRGLWTQLPRQDDAELRFYHGNFWTKG